MTTVFYYNDGVNDLNEATLALGRYNNADSAEFILLTFSHWQSLAMSFNRVDAFGLIICGVWKTTSVADGWYVSTKFLPIVIMVIVVLAVKRCTNSEQETARIGSTIKATSALSCQTPSEWTNVCPLVRCVRSLVLIASWPFFDLINQDVSDNVRRWRRNC